MGRPVNRALFEQAEKAARSMNHEELKALLSREPELGRWTSYGGETLLAIAAGSNDPDLAAILLPLSDIGAVSTLGMTALGRAAWDAQEDMVRFLVENGAPTSWEDPIKGHDALMLAAMSNWHPDCVTCARAIAPRADALRRSKEGKTAFDMAMAIDRIEIAEIAWGSLGEAQKESVAAEWGASVIASIRKARNAESRDQDAYWAMADDMALRAPHVFEAFHRDELAQSERRKLPKLTARMESDALREAVGQQKEEGLGAGKPTPSRPPKAL
jgi:ankyrin repeat protein